MNTMRCAARWIVMSPRTDDMIGDGIPEMSPVLIAATLNITSSDEHWRYLPSDHFSRL